MEIQNPKSIGKNLNLEVLLAEVDAELNRFRLLGDFPTEVHEEIQRAFLPERISDTLNIEGIRVNPRITRAILEGLSLAESDQYNEQEVLNVIQANELIESESAARTKLSVQLIRELHRRIENGLIDSAGSFRQKDVMITGAVEQPPAWSDCADLVNELCNLYEQSAGVHPIVRAAWLHATFTRIHPFEDGNGRSGRLLQDFALLLDGFLPVGIPANLRQQYYNALEAADRGEWQQIVEVIANSELSALDRARRIGEAPVKRRERVQNLLRMANQTTKQREYRQYELWRRRVEGVVDEFSRWAEDIGELDGLHISKLTYNPISFEKWKEVSRGEHVSGTWILGLKFFVNRIAQYSFVFYVKRHDSSLVLADRNLEEGQVGIFLTGQDEPRGRYKFGIYDDRYISLREITFDGPDLLSFYQRNPESHFELPEGVGTSLLTGKWSTDVDFTIGDVVEKFYLEVLTKLGLTA